MKRERATRWKIRNRILSLFLIMCMVAGLLPQGIVPVKAANATKYQVGNTELSMDSTADNPQLGDDGAWEWNGEGKTLTFRKNIKITQAATTESGAIYLPAGSRLEILGGLRVEVTSHYGDALYCEGNLTIVGGGGLMLFGSQSGDVTQPGENQGKIDGNTMESDIPGGDGDKVVGSGLVCRGTLTIGETSGKLANKRPLVFCSSYGYTDHTIEVGSQAAESVNAVELVKGQVTISARPEGTGKIFRGGTIRNINIQNDAVLLYPNAVSNVEERNDITRAKLVEGVGLFCGQNEDYYHISYVQNGGAAPPTKENVYIMKGDFANLFVTTPSPAGKYFVGWCESADGSGTVYSKEDKYEVTKDQQLFAIFKDLEDISEALEVKRTKSQLILPATDLPDAKYVITYTVNGDEKVKTVDAGEAEVIVDLDELAGTDYTASDIQKISVKLIQNIGSGYEEQDVSGVVEFDDFSTKKDEPTEAEFVVTQATKANPKASIVKKDSQGLTSEYEYRIGDGEWLSGSEAPLEVDVKAEDIIVSIRKAATDGADGSWASDPIKITLSGVKEETPNGSYNYKDSEITGLEPGDYTIKVGDGEEKTVTIDDTGKTKVEVPDGTTEINIVKKGEGDTTGDSDTQTITLTQPTEVGQPGKDSYEWNEDKTKITVKSGYEYRKKTGDASEWPEGWIKGEVVVEVGEDDIIQIRKVATDDAPASLPIQVAKGLKITIDYEAEKLVGFESGVTYEITVDGKKTEVTPSGDNVAIDESYFGKTISIAVKEDADSEPCEVAVPARPAANIDFSDLEDELVDGDERLELQYTIKAGYQYRIGENGTWENSPAAVPVTAGEKLYLRNEATGEKFASVSSIAYEGDAKEFTPNAEVNYNTGKLTGLVANAEYEIGGMGTVTASADGEIDLEPYYGKVISIAKKGVTLENGATTRDSDAQNNIEIYEKAETPNEDDFVPELDGNWMLIKNVPNTYEFSVNGGAAWNRETVDQNEEDTEEHPDWGTYIRVAVGTDVLIRRIAEDGKAPSDPITITTQEKTPNAKVDYTSGKLTGLVANANYEITVDGKKSAVTADASGKADLEPYYGKTISIVKKGDGTKTTDSDAQELTVKAKTQAPDKNQFKTESDGKKTTIKPVPNDYEYSTDGGETWKPVENGEITVDNGTDVLIRKKGTENDPPSESVTIKAEAKSTPEATPAAKVDYTTGKLTNLVANAKYEITVDGKKNTVTADASGKIELDPYCGKTISIVKKGNGTTTTDSQAQSLTINAKKTTPSESKFDTQVNDDGNIVIKNITSDMEYSLDDGKTWKPGTGKDLVVSVGTKVLIRVKATATTPASTPIVINTVSKVSTVEAITKTITSTNTDKNIDVPGSTFSKIRLKATGKSTSIKLTWKKVSGATGYIIYGSKCGTKMKKIKTIKGASKKTYTQKKLKAGKFYKYIVAAYKVVDGKQVVLATSKSAHAMTTKNSKYSNPKSVKVKTSKVTLKKGKSKTIKASYVMPKNKKQKVHIKKFRYESSNKAVATVSSKGKIKAKKKGKATIYVIAQNGVYKTIKVTVK